MEIIEEAQVVFFQVIGRNCTFYAMGRLGTVCVAVEMAKIKSAYTISDVLAGFEEDVRGWLLVDRTFQNLVSTLQSAVPRKPDGTDKIKGLFLFDEEFIPVLVVIDNVFLLKSVVKARLLCMRKKNERKKRQKRCVQLPFPLKLLYPDDGVVALKKK